MSTASARVQLDDPITRHMRREVARLHVRQTVGEALEALHQKPPEGRIIYFYVVDDENRLKGVVPTRRLLLNPADRPIADIMVPNVITVPDSATVLEACEFFTLHRLLAFPVVDAERKLLGVVDVELYTQELDTIETHASDEELFQLIGVYLTQKERGSAWASFRARFPWLLCNIVGGILAAFLSSIFQEELQQAVALALFIPVVLALAESVSIQSVSLALQVLQGPRPSWRQFFRQLRIEGLTGILLGSACAILVALVAGIWLRQWQVTLSLLGGIAGGVAVAAVFGLSAPTLLRILRANPQIASGPIVLASADMATLLIYFNLARGLMHL